MWKDLEVMILELLPNTNLDLIHIYTKIILYNTNFTLYGLVSPFDVMMQGFYRESQERSKSVAHYIARLEG